MSWKARRRPSWKAYRKGEDCLIIHILREEDDSLIEKIRIPKMGYFGRYLVSQYGVQGAEEWLRKTLVDFAEEVLAIEEYYNDQALQHES